MKTLPYSFLRHATTSALITLTSQICYAGLLGDNFSLYRTTTYQLNGEFKTVQSEFSTFTAGSETPLPGGIIMYDQEIDLFPQPYSLPAGAKLQSDQYVFNNQIEAFLSVQVNEQKTTLSNWSDKTIFFNNSNIFFVNFFGLPIDGTAVLVLDIRTVSDATAVPEPDVASLTFIGALMWLLAKTGGRRAWPAICISINEGVLFLRLLTKGLGKL
ncbi:MAG TPA: hypothetical protein VF797_13545 [Noviherbaspirillum sp.]